MGTAREATVAGNGGTPAPTVREATFDVLRTLGLTTIFSNPREQATVDYVTGRFG